MSDESVTLEIQDIETTTGAAFVLGIQDIEPSGAASAQAPDLLLEDEG